MPVNEPGPAVNPMRSNSRGATPRLRTQGIQHAEQVLVVQAFNQACILAVHTGAAARHRAGFRCRIQHQQVRHGGQSIQALTITEATRRLSELVGTVAGEETVATAAGLQRVASSALRSPINVPAFANSAMDGYALRSSDCHGDGPWNLPVQGQSLAGHPFSASLQPGHAVRIFTGAPLPAGADCVAIQENVETGDGVVCLTSVPAAGTYVRGVGHDVRAGATLAAVGTRLTAFHLAAAATSGVTRIAVHRKPRIGVFATGDELREPGTELAPGQIYESNRLAILSLLAPLPLELTDLGIVPDDPDQTRQQLAAAAATQECSDHQRRRIGGRCRFRTCRHRTQRNAGFLAP